MNNYQFAGHIYPAGIIYIKDFELDAPGLFGYDNPFSGDINVSIDNDNVIVTYKTTEDFDNDLDTLRNSLEYFARMAIDAANYYFGTGVELFLTTGGNTSKQMYTFAPKVNSLFSQINERPLNPMEITKLAGRNIQLRRALEHAKNAINQKMDAGMNCYRAIEAIRQYFLNGKTDDGGAKRKSWEDMNNSLRLQQNFYALVKSHADVARHGGAGSISSTDMEKMLHCTWRIIDRFLIYLNNGDIALGEKYEVLT